MATRILLADDHKIVREGLKALILRQAGMEVVAEAEDGRSTVAQARKLTPDIVIMDIGMPDLNGIEATRQITVENPTIKIIALSMHSDRRFISQMLRAGASGYLLKDCAFEELTTAIHAVAANKTYLSPEITRPIIDDYVRQLSDDEPPSRSGLSPREREVVQLIAEGKNTREISISLNISTKTVDTHRFQIMNKLHVKSVAELIKYAIREGLTSLDK